MYVFTTHVCFLLSLVRSSTSCSQSCYFLLLPPFSFFLFFPFVSPTFFSSYYFFCLVYGPLAYFFVFVWLSFHLFQSLLLYFVFFRMSLATTLYTRFGRCSYCTAVLDVVRTRGNKKEESPCISFMSLFRSNLRGCCECKQCRRIQYNNVGKSY